MTSVVRSRTVNRYPVTLLLAMQYGAFAVWPAWHHHNPAYHFVWWITAVGVGSAAAVETACSAPTWAVDEPVRSPVTARAGLVLCAVGIGSHVLQIASVGVKYGEAPRTSAVSVLLTPVHSWTFLGLACLLYSWRSDDLSRRRLFVYLGVIEVVWFWYTIFVLGRSAPFMSYSLAVASGCVLAGAVRALVVAVGVVAAVLLWPTIAGLRNETRAARGSEAQYGEYDPSARLREDLLLANADEIPAHIHAGQAGLLTAIRFGVVPRFIDSNRTTLATGRNLSVAFGSTDTSSYTLTALGTTRAFTDTTGMIAITAMLAAAVRALRNRNTTLRLALVMALIQADIWIESAYPDGVAAAIQDLISLSFALAVARGLSIRVAARHNMPTRSLSCRSTA